MEIREYVPLASFTTMRVGGPARYFVEVNSEEEVIEAIRLAASRGWDIFVLGKGSNIVVSDEGFPGLVILNKIRGFRSEQRGDRVYVEVGAGEVWDDFVSRAVEAGWQGVENLSGVPGSVGAAPVQNVGCYGQSVEDVIVSVRAVRIPDGSITTFGKEECRFRYRDSIFRSEEYGRYVITRVVFALHPGGKANVSAYPDIVKYFEGWERTPSLSQMRQAILEIRAAKGMLIMPPYERYLSVGSFFKNPVVPEDVARRIQQQAEALGNAGGRWVWPAQDGLVKLSAARLVELAGFPRGFREGNVGISPKHSLAIIHHGGATAEEIAAFAKKIQTAVMEKFGVTLEPEAQFVGAFIHSCHDKP